MNDKKHIKKIITAKSHHVKEYCEAVNKGNRIEIVLELYKDDEIDIVVAIKQLNKIYEK